MSTLLGVLLQVYALLLMAIFTSTTTSLRLDMTFLSLRERDLSSRKTKY